MGKENNRNYIIPTYLQGFQCIGGACEDTCCAGWQIMVDEASYQRYKKVKNPDMARRLKKELVQKDNGTGEYAAKIKLKNGRCAFLNKKDLCDIYATLGEEQLCNTCTMYPRTVNQVGNAWEYSLAVSCPEAARQILLRKEGIDFQVVNSMPKYNRDVIYTKIALQEDHPKVWQDYFSLMRKEMLVLLQDRSYSIVERIINVSGFLEGIEKRVRAGKEKQLSAFIAGYRVAITPATLAIAVEKEQARGQRVISCLQPFLSALIADKKLKGEKYKGWFEKNIRSLAAQNIGEELEKYEKYYVNYFLPLQEKYAYVLENYWCNYIFSGCVPLDEQTPLKSLKRLLAYNDLLFFHFFGLAIEKEEVVEQEVVALIQYLAKHFEHNEAMEQKLRVALELC